MFTIIKKYIYNLCKWWIEEQYKLCPVCGYYCNGKSRFCIPPITDHPTNNKWKVD